MAGLERPLTPEELAGLRARVARCPRRPALATICLGQLPAWVGQDCAACGIYCEQYALPLGMGEKGLWDLLEGLGGREDMDGILIWPLSRPQGVDGLLAQAVPRGKWVEGTTWAGALEGLVDRAARQDS